MHGVHSRIGGLKLAIGESICIGDTCKPGDFFAAFGPVLLNVLVSKQIDTHAATDIKASAVVRITMAHSRGVSALQPVFGFHVHLPRAMKPGTPVFTTELSLCLV